jgi:membrane dipeptidase
VSSLDQARELLGRSPLIDGHNDLPWAMRIHAGYDWDKADPGVGADRFHTDLPRLRAGGVGAQFWSVYVPSDLPGDTAVTATLEQIDFVHQMVGRLAGDLGLALSAADIERVFASGRIASLLGAEGGHSIACSMGALRAMHALGVRYMTLTHNDNNPWADSATDEPGVGGLNGFGRAVVGEMNRLGMLVDLSHVAESTMNAALDATEAPVIFSHSSCRELVGHPRNVPDPVLERLAGNGGLCMVTFVPVFVSEACYAWSLELKGRMDEVAPPKGDPDRLEVVRKVMAEFRETNPEPQASLDDVVTHVEHAREVAGVEHIGLGGDYDGLDRLPIGLEDVSGYPKLIAALLDRGWSEEDCRALMGGNLLRALRDAEEVADRLRRERSPSLAKLSDFA